MEQIIDLEKTPMKKLRELLRSLPNTDDHFVLRNNGHFLGAVLSIKNYEDYLMARQAEAQKDLQSFLDTIQPQVDPNISDDERDRQIVDAIHEARRSIRNKSLEASDASQNKS